MNKFKRLAFSKNPGRITRIPDNTATLWNEDGDWYQDVGSGAELFNATPSGDPVVVVDTENLGSSTIEGDNELIFSADNVTYGPTAASVQGNYYKPDEADFDELVVEFYAISDEIELVIERSGYIIQIYVDDVQVHEIAVEGYDDRLYKLTFANGRAERKIKIKGKNYGFGGVHVPGTNLNTTWPVENRVTRPLLAVMADSYGNGVDADYGNSYIEQLAESLDMDLYSDSLNSSGWSSINNALTTARANSMVQMHRAPDVILVCLGFNDQYATQLAVETGINDWHADIAAGLPSAAVILCGPFTPEGPTTAFTNIAGWISARAAALSVDFVDVSDILTEENFDEYFGTDSVHPNAAGHTHIASRLRPLLVRTESLPSS